MELKEIDVYPRLPEPVEPFAQQGEAAPRNLGQLDRAPETTEERRVQVVLEKLDLTADRAGGHAQFPGRFRKTEVVRRRLERSQGIERRQSGPRRPGRRRVRFSQRSA